MHFQSAEERAFEVARTTREEMLAYIGAMDGIEGTLVVLNSLCAFGICSRITDEFFLIELPISTKTKQSFLTDSGESDADSEDSNDENNWRNEYPDEESNVRFSFFSVSSIHSPSFCFSNRKRRF